jgi:predicted phage terminase large subunit-like protein
MKEVLSKALLDPKTALHQIEKLMCQNSLYHFVQAAWHILHASNEPFTKGWAIETLCRHLEAITRGDVDKLLVNIPPGCTKSMIVNVMWPLWEWGPKGRPQEKYISAGYNQDLPIRDLGHARDIMRSEWFTSHWPLQNKKDSDSKESYTNTKNGWRKAIGVGGGLTGWRGTRVIIDDPHSTKTAESDIERSTARSWFLETVPTRFNRPEKPVYVIIKQRLNVADLSGTVIEKLAEKQGWVHLCLPMRAELKYRSWTPVPNGTEPKRMRRVKEDAEPTPYYVEDPEGELLYCQDPRQEEGELLWPERFPEAAVADLEASFEAEGGGFAIACQLQQRPVPRSGGMFRREALNFVDHSPTEGIWCRGWDLAATKDGGSAYTVGTKMCISRGKIYITDVMRFRGSPGEVMTTIRTCAEQDGFEVSQNLPQDPGQAGKAQKTAIAQMLHGYDFGFSAESGTKEDRARPLAAQVEVGNVYIVRGPWNDNFVGELSLFPGAKHKDQIDAASRAYTHLLRDTGHCAAVAPKLISGA